MTFTKTKLVIAASCAVMLTTMAFIPISDNGIAGKTGSPGENTCIQCHTGSVINDGVGSVTITSTNMPNMQYMPGQTYTMQVTVARTGNPLFGLGVEALTSTNANAGTLVVTNTTENTIKTITISTVVRRNIVHNLNGGATANSHTFTFDWTAPATNVGNVTFYVTGVAANANGAKTGDNVYSTTQIITPDPAAGISDVNASSITFHAFPVPAHDQLTLSYKANAGDDLHATLYTLEGRKVMTLVDERASGQDEQKTIQLPVDLAAGMYFIRFNAGDAARTQRIEIQ